jgi:Na+-driven multidrug efflux pump
MIQPAKDKKGEKSMADNSVSLPGNKNVLFTNRQLVTLMWPLLLEQMLAIAVGLADSLMVATVGDAAISAVSLVDSISNLMIYIFSAMATGGAAVAGQYIGQKRF